MHRYTTERRRRRRSPISARAGPPAARARGRAGGRRGGRRPPARELASAVPDRGGEEEQDDPSREGRDGGLLPGPPRGLDRERLRERPLDLLAGGEGRVRAPPRTRPGRSRSGSRRRSEIGASSTRRASRNVPFPLPRSLTIHPSPFGATRAWRRETVGEARRTSQPGSRPTVDGPVQLERATGAVLLDGQGRPGRGRVSSAGRGRSRHASDPVGEGNPLVLFEVGRRGDALPARAPGRRPRRRRSSRSGRGRRRRRARRRRGPSRCRRGPPRRRGRARPRGRASCRRRRLPPRRACCRRRPSRRRGCCAPVTPSTWKAVASASSRFRPPVPRPFTVTVVSPPKIVTSRRCGAPALRTRFPAQAPARASRRAADAGLADEEVGDDPDVGARAGEPRVRAPSRRRPDVAEKDAPALPAVPRRRPACGREQVGADGGGTSGRSRYWSRSVTASRRDGGIPRVGPEATRCQPASPRSERTSVTTSAARAAAREASPLDRERAPRTTLMSAIGAPAAERSETVRALSGSEIVSAGSAIRLEPPPERRTRRRSSAPRLEASCERLAPGGEAPLVGDRVRRRAGTGSPAGGSSSEAPAGAMTSESSTSVPRAR